MAVVEFESVSKSFNGTVALREVSFRAADGEFLVIVGPSGCGKSTVLRLMAGLETPDSGRILVDQRDVTGKPPKERGCAMVFQSYALYPHWSVFDNLAFPLRVRRIAKEEITRRVTGIAASLQLSDQLRKRPKELSGGQRQRVALGRAIAADPQILLLDEPLSNLDAPLRAEMRREIVARQKALAKTALYVTHDQTEALTMADRILVMNAGAITGAGTPTELYDNPPNRFVATFLGRPPINLMTVTIERDDSQWNFSRLAWPVPEAACRKLAGSVPETLELGIRPEHLHVTGVDPVSPWRITGREFLGDKLHYSVTNGRDTLTILGDRGTAMSSGVHVNLGVALDRIMLFNPADGQRLA